MNGYRGAPESSVDDHVDRRTEHRDGRWPSMAAAELVAKTRRDEHADRLREGVTVGPRMETELRAESGAGDGEVSPGRHTHRNGYRARSGETRVGELERRIPRKRSGAAPSRCSRRSPAPSRSASAGMPRHQVSAGRHALDEGVGAFRCRPLQGAYP